MAKHYKVTITFSGMASLTLDAENAEDARAKIAALKIEDLARQGYAEITQFKSAARDITRSDSVLHNDDGDDASAARKPRPSGWYRPLDS
ncbi:MAG TPA: hypothetical protein VGK19_08290 [Capsulimonadaceae bacterium]|jgi:hypothetical protein